MPADAGDVENYLGSVVATIGETGELTERKNHRRPLAGPRGESTGSPSISGPEMHATIFNYFSKGHLLRDPVPSV
jgi:hypothetical protein